MVECLFYCIFSDIPHDFAKYYTLLSMMYRNTVKDLNPFIAHVSFQDKISIFIQSTPI